MPPTFALLIILSITIIILLLFILLFKKTRNQAAGICATALDQTVRKSANTEKALVFIKERGQASNEDIREHLGVSRQSAARYMDTLERQGAVEQIGKSGRSVLYRIK